MAAPKLLPFNCHSKKVVLLLERRLKEKTIDSIEEEESVG